MIRPASLMSLLGVGGDCVTLPRGGRSSVPHGGTRPATRRMRRPVGTLTQHVADRIIRSLAQMYEVSTQHGRVWDADISFSWQEKLLRVGSLKLLQIFGCDMKLKLKKLQLLFSFACCSHGTRIKNAQINGQIFQFYTVFVSAFLKSLKAFEEATALH